jgi:hypothetical protein
MLRNEKVRRCKSDLIPGGLEVDEPGVEEAGGGGGEGAGPRAAVVALKGELALTARCSTAPAVGAVADNFAYQI